MQILVCGGAGYIGSHMVKQLSEAGHDVCVFDNLSTGHREAVQWGRLEVGDIRSPEDLDRVLSSENFDAVMHFSAKSLVGESVEQPADYYDNNVFGTWQLLEAMRRFNVQSFIFSSTAAVYGHPNEELISEDHPTLPINPYGRTKLAVERMLGDYAKAYGINSVALRYFNAAGADPSAKIGEAHEPETHLIPNILKSLADDSTRLKVFGNDYPSVDGTCVRDYIHVSDLCQAHLLAVEYLKDHCGHHCFNLGIGRGFSVMEVIDAASRVVGHAIPYDVVERRPGDPSHLVADSSLARKKLQWNPEYTDIGDIIRTAWQWHQAPQY